MHSWKRAPQRLAAFALAVLILLSDIPAGSASSAAVNITAKCTFTPSSNASAFRYATDGNYATKWTSVAASSRYIDFTISAATDIGGIYFIWSSAPASWELYAYESSGKMTEMLEGGTEGYLTQYVYIPSEYAAYKKFRLSMTSVTANSAMDIAELEIFSQGEAPYYAPQWKPFEGRADLLTISAHPDDEDLYLGVPAVTYADQGMKCATVFMTYGSTSASVRRYEAQESVWCLHNPWYPTMGNFKDVKTDSKEAQMKYWPLYDTVGFIVEQIRKYKPSVIVTHGERGEYGHGGHILTEYATTLAFQSAADASKYPASAKKYGTWQAGKLYVHLYTRNALNAMSLTTTLPGYGGRTVLQSVSDAYNRHDSQLPGRSLPTSGSYDMRRFGLYLTSLGADTTHDTMFEHVTEDAMLRLNPGYIYEVVDRSTLEWALSDAAAKVEANYTPESWAEAGLPAAISAAQVVMDDDIAMQDQVDEHAAALNAAVAKLVAYLKAISLASPPDRLAYTEGESLDLEGLAVTASYSDGVQKVLSAEDMAISGFDSTAAAAAHAVTVSYADAYSTQSVSFYVDILPAEGEQIRSAVYTIDREKRTVTDVSPGTTAEQLLANLDNDAANFTLYNWDGSVYAGGAVATGMVLKLTVDGIVTDALRIAVLGDVNCDGAVDINDILCIRADIAGAGAFRACQAYAADVSRDGAVDINDILCIHAYILGTCEIHT